MTNDLIRRKDLIKSFDGNIEYYTADETIEMIEDAPAVNAVEVVFCENCIYQKDAKVNCKGFIICPVSNMEITDDDYCSYGERRESEVKE